MKRTVQYDMQYKLYGRKYGRALKEARKLALTNGAKLYSIEPQVGASPALYFNAPKQEFWIEIGFGNGEHTLYQALHNNNIGIIGCDPYLGGVSLLLQRLLVSPLDNIKIFTGHGLLLLKSLPPESIAKIFILFPDPWPKKRHASRRFLSTMTLETIGTVLACGGELRIATDCQPYAQDIMNNIKNTSNLEQNHIFTSVADKPPDWQTTNYELRAIRNNSLIHYMIFKQKKHAS